MASYILTHTRIPFSLTHTHSLSSCVSDGVHDGVHVEVALIGRGWAYTHGLVCHLHVNLKENHKHTQRHIDTQPIRNRV